MKQVLRKRILLCVVLLLSSLILTGCGHIEDTNGEDPSLVTIGIEKLTGSSISYTSSGVSTRTSRKNFTIVMQHEEIDYDYLEMTGGKTSGVRSIMATELKEGQTLSIHCESNVQSGNLAVILVSPGNEILHTFPVGTFDTYTTPPAAEKGIYFVRIGTESYSGVILLEREID